MTYVILSGAVVALGAAVYFLLIRNYRVKGTARDLADAAKDLGKKIKG